MSNNGKTGRWVWEDLKSTKIDESRDFFTNLFGWSTDPVDMGGGSSYEMLKNGHAAQAFGGLNTIEGSSRQPSHWLSYLSTPDVDSLTFKASDLGGTILLEPTDIPGIGRFSILTDPQGATFAAYTDTNAAWEPAAPTVQPHGGIAWHELMTSDVDAALAFYSALFNWSSRTVDMGTGPYTLLKAGDHEVAGLMKKPDDQVPTAWTVYFEVDDIQKSLDKVGELGGNVLMGPMEVSTVGELGWAIDPSGAVFAMIQSAPQPATS
jgi:uncharacterized protein